MGAGRVGQNLGSQTTLSRASPQIFADGRRSREEQKASTGLAFALHKSGNYFLGEGAIASFVAFATRNFTTVLALI